MKKTKKTVEAKASETILQQSEEVTIGGEKYWVAPPSTATLILASEHISQLPHVSLDSENIAGESLYVARDCRALGDIVAILVLGAKGLSEVRKTTVRVEKRRFFGLIRHKEEVEKEVTVDHRAALAKKLLENVTPRELHLLMVRLLQFMQLGDFFGLTTSLIAINLLRRTRGVVATTASGR